MSRRRPLAVHADSMDGGPGQRGDLRERIASWVCLGQTMYWHAKGERLFHDSLAAPHGRPTGDEHRVLQALAGCTCEKTMERAKRDAISEVRNRSSYSYQRMLGRSERASPRWRRMSWLGTADQLAQDARARFHKRMIEAIGPRLCAVTDNARGADLLTAAHAGVAVRVGAFSRQQYVVSFTWIVTVLATGLHDDLHDLLVLSARPAGAFATCVALSYFADFHPVCGSPYWRTDAMFRVLRICATRVDGRWLESERRVLFDIDVSEQPDAAFGSLRAPGGPGIQVLAT